MEQKPTSLTPEDLAAARETLEQLLQAVQRGDEAAVREMIIIGEGENMDFESMHNSTAAYELGEPEADGDVVVVTTDIHEKPEDDGTVSATVHMPFVLTKADGTWKVDMSATIQRMMGFDLGDAMTQMAEGLGNAMAKGMEAMAEGFSALSSGDETADQGDDQEFRDALDFVRGTMLPEQADLMSDTLGKPLDVVMAWYSFRGAGDAVGLVSSLTLDELSRAIGRVCVDPDDREKLQGVLDRVVVRHVGQPDQRLCILDAGQLELAVCLTDRPDEGTPPGTFTADDIEAIFRQAIG